MEVGEPVFHESSADCRTGSVGTSLLTLVNKDKVLLCNWRPEDLVRLPKEYLVPRRYRSRRPIYLRKDAADALLQMIEAGENDGAPFALRSGFRSFKRQRKLFRKKVKEHGGKHASRYSAKPGRSQHQLGTAVDLSSAEVGWEIEEPFARSNAGRWLVKNAFRFGYVLSYPKGQEAATGYAFEPWHFRYIGRPAAKEMRTAGVSLEEYLWLCDNSDSQLGCPLASQLASLP